MKSAKRSISKIIGVGAGLAVLATAALSLIHPWGNLHTSSSTGAAILSGANASEDVRNTFIHKCGDCHSNSTKWPAYSKVAPASWFVEHDVHEGREHLNFSDWDKYSTDTRIDLLARIGSEVRQGKMPLKQYLLLHPEARLSDSERAQIRDWTKAERKRLMTQETK